MSKYLHIKKFICKLLTVWMPSKQRILYRDALYWFSLSDYLRFKHANYQIVSLGSDCLPRGLTTAIKLKPRRFYGEKSCVFDLYLSNIKRNTELIENNFSDFFEKANLEDFPHDYTLPKDIFVKRYKQRIQNFLDIMQSDKILYFIYSDYDEVPSKEDVQKLYQVLENKRCGKPFKLIILTSEYIDEPNIIQFPEKLTIDDVGWLVYMVDEYNEYDNKFTKYRDKMKNNLLTCVKFEPKTLEKHVI